VGRRNTARQGCWGPGRKHSAARSGSTASLVYGRGLYGDRFYGHVNCRSSSEARRCWDDRARCIDRRGALGGGMVVKHETAQSRIQDYGG
jgi:hypothetical protein